MGPRAAGGWIGSQCGGCLRICCCCGCGVAGSGRERLVCRGWFAAYLWVSCVSRVTGVKALCPWFGLAIIGCGNVVCVLIAWTSSYWFVPSLPRIVRSVVCSRETECRLGLALCLAHHHVWGSGP